MNYPADSGHSIGHAAPLVSDRSGYALVRRPSETAR
jgi:hypothetical protein